VYQIGLCILFAQVKEVCGTFQPMSLAPDFGRHQAFLSFECHSMNSGCRPFLATRRLLDVFDLKRKLVAGRPSAGNVKGMMASSTANACPYALDVADEAFFGSSKFWNGGDAFHVLVSRAVLKQKLRVEDRAEQMNVTASMSATKTRLLERLTN
jgi:hypothetical protein